MLNYPKSLVGGGKTDCWWGRGQLPRLPQWKVRPSPWQGVSVTFNIIDLTIFTYAFMF